MYKKSRVELGCALMTVENEKEVCGKHKKSRMEIGCKKQQLRIRARSVEDIKRAEWTLDAQ